MRKFILVCGLWTIAMLPARAAEPLLPRLTPDEFSAAGLAKLSPEELARLEALFAKYGAGVAVKPVAPVAAAVATASAPTPAPKAEPDQASAKQMAAQLAAAEERVRQAQQEAAAAREMARAAKAEQKSAEEGFLTKAKKILVSPGTKVEVAAIESQIDGWFNGWDNQTVWKLKDGTMWRVENNTARYTAKRTMDPKVKIYPATLAGYWLEFPELDLKVRVRQAY